MPTSGFRRSSSLSPSIRSRCSTKRPGHRGGLFSRDLGHHFTDVLTKYSHALLIHSLRMTGCTGLHSLEQRCARWMLTTLDRVPAHRFSVTHEFLATLLGCSRPSASEGLLDVSCECYEIIRENYAQVGS